MDLPVAYSEIYPTSLPSGDIYVPLTSGNLTPSCDNLSDKMEKE